MAKMNIFKYFCHCCKIIQLSKAPWAILIIELDLFAFLMVATYCELWNFYGWLCEPEVAEGLEHLVYLIRISVHRQVWKE